MKSALLELPDECICAIFSFLSPSQVKRVALTFSRRLFAIAEPFLEPLTKIKKDEAYFESIFGEGDWWAHVFSEEGLRKLKFTDLPISIPARLSHHLEYLDLKGDLSWLEDIAAVDTLDLVDIDGHVANWTDDEDLEMLIKTTTNLGLTLPQSFIKLLKSEKLLKKLATAHAWHIDLSSLYKIRKPLNDDPTQYEEGYIFTWSEDQQGCGYRNMYLDTAGRHAILYSDGGPMMSKEEDEGEEEDEEDRLLLTDLDKREGIQQVSTELDEQTLEDVDFERWLVNYYYRSRVSFWDDSECPDFMKPYFCNVYTEEGRRMQ